MKNLLLAISVVAFLTASLMGHRHHRLYKVIKKNGLSAYKADDTKDSIKIELGRLLFFDKILSGNKDVSCATCHHPGLNSGDNLPLAIGVGGTGLGTSRKMGPGRERIPRNSPEIFNRGAREWHSMFWDSRVTGSPESGFVTPANEKLPDGLDHILAVQAMFPVFSRDEMRGEIGDKDVFGKTNELALISNAAPNSVWHQLMNRVLSFPEYETLFRKAYPQIKPENLGFQHAANAIAAFEISAFTFTNSPWDHYLAGDKSSLTNEQLEGAILFYETAKCNTCHAGNLFTDQKHHNIAVPQFGPGKDDAAPLDIGRFMETGLPNDKFAFRTPPLRNVAITGPWMHNGAFDNLRDVILHHLDPEKSLRNYDVNQIPNELKNSYKGSKEVIDRMLSTLDASVRKMPDLNDQDLNNLLAFLEALTDASATDLSSIIPERVPSGLAVEGEIREPNY